MIKNLPRVMIAGASSGSGKTTVVCGILGALKKRGIDVSACKCGPDYIDTMFHSEVMGISSKNLDKFFCGERLCELFYKHSKDSDITVIEGVMGYYDGIAMDSFYSSSYDIARSLDTPVILVINGKGMALTAVSIIKGIMDFKKDSNIKGVIFNNISNAVFLKLKYIVERELGIFALGYLPHTEDYAVESRHLGLVLPKDIKNIAYKIDRLAEMAEECIDIDRIVSISKESKVLHFRECEPVCAVFSNVKIGVALDDAFCFYYKDNIQLLESLGCEIVYFSPMKDKFLPEGISGVIFGGGYPELYLEELSQNREMREDIKNELEKGLPALAECGGFMYLHKTVSDKKGNPFDMVGFIDSEASFKGRLVRFGYITLKANYDSYVLKTGEKIRAHEFHYWDSSDNGELFLAEKPFWEKRWNCVHSVKNVICGYPHIFYYSNVNFIKRFVEKCAEFERL